MELRISFAPVSHEFQVTYLGTRMSRELKKRQLRGSIFSSSLKVPAFLRKIFVLLTSHVGGSYCASLRAYVFSAGMNSIQFVSTLSFFVFVGTRR